MLTAWSTFQPTNIIGSSCESPTMNLTDVTERWFNDYMKQFKGIKVPSKY